ncbi:MAG: thermonuclease family protein [Sphingomonadaceae bacterium]
MAMTRIARWLRRLFAILVLIALILAYAWIEEIGIGAREHGAAGQQVIVRDGDTLQIGKTEYRLSGIDAPEYRQDCADVAGRAWPCGRQARSRLAALVATGDLGCTPRATDRYGRAIATCRAKGAPDIAEAMVAAGLAINEGGFGEGDYAGIEAEARAAKRGIWQGRFTPPAEWRAAHPRGGDQDGG